jgi:Skp family chaperone for outer membrane proteins
MNLFKKFFLIIFILLFGISKSYSDQKVAFIDLDFVFENSIAGKKILKELKDLNSENINKLKSRENDLKLKDEELKKKQNIISESEFKKEVNLLKDKIKIFRNEKNLMVSSYNKKKNERIKNLFDQINPIIQNYMEQNSIDILLDRKNVYIGNIGSDITKNVIDEINKNIKK